MAEAMATLPHATLHDAAALVLVIGGAAFVLMAFRARRALALQGAGAGVAPQGVVRHHLEGSVRPLAAILAGLSAGAAAIHLAAAPHHFRELGDLGAGFLVAAVFQAAWARLWLAGPSPRLALVGLIGNGAILAGWAMSRTLGLGVLGLGAAPEPIGLPDGAATVFEVLLLIGLLGVRTGLGGIVGRLRAVRELAPITVVPVVGLVIVVASLSVAAIAMGLDHGLPEGVTLPEGHGGH